MIKFLLIHACVFLIIYSKFHMKAVAIKTNFEKKYTLLGFHIIYVSLHRKINILILLNEAFLIMHVNNVKKNIKFQFLNLRLKWLFWHRQNLSNFNRIIAFLSTFPKEDLSHSPRFPNVLKLFVRWNPVPLHSSFC